MNPAHSLDQAQQSLLDALFPHACALAPEDAAAALAAWTDNRHPQASRGLAAYRANGHALAERALGAAYPVTAAVLGEDSFAMLARALWHRMPPTRGDIARWGDTLAAFAQEDPQLAGLPWLADLARVEWALHRAATAHDVDSDAGSFALLHSHDPSGLRLRLAPGLHLVQSRWPVASIVNAHLLAQPPLDEAWRRTRDGVSETAVVWRAGPRCRVGTATEPAAALLGLLIGGADLLRALDGACEVAAGGGQPFDFSAWLSASVQDGLVLGVEPLAA